MLTADGICRNHGRDKWYEFTIDYILNNERYMGDALLQKSFTTESLPFKKVRNIGQQPQYYVENSNPAIVSRETYAAAQELQKQRSTGAGQKKSTYTLTGSSGVPTAAEPSAVRLSGANPIGYVLEKHLEQPAAGACGCKSMKCIMFSP